MFSHHLYFPSHSNVTFEHHIFSQFSRHSSIISFGSIGSIGLNALQEDTPTPAPASTTVSAPREDLRQKGSQSLGFRILSAHQGAIIFLVRFACLSFAVTVGSKYSFFHNGHCDFAIDPYSPRRYENVPSRLQSTAQSCSAIRQFRIIDPSSFATSQRCRRTQVS